jgi:hypothetical protein
VAKETEWNGWGNGGNVGKLEICNLTVIKKKGVGGCENIAC